MKKALLLLPLALLVLLAAFSNGVPRAFAHTTIKHGDINVNVGWGTEPPLVGQLNTFVIEVTRVSDGKPITNALAQTDVTIKKGTTTKPLDMQPAEEPGLYSAEILPTQTGQLSVLIKGTIGGQTFNDEAKIEDVESTQTIEFPQGSTGNGNPIPQQVIDQLHSVITDLTAQVDQANNAAGDAKKAADSATSTATDLKLAADRAYLFGIIGVGVGVAGIAIGVVALSRRSKV